MGSIRRQSESPDSGDSSRPPWMARPSVWSHRSSSRLIFGTRLRNQSRSIVSSTPVVAFPSLVLRLPWRRVVGRTTLCVALLAIDLVILVAQDRMLSGTLQTLQVSPAVPPPPQARQIPIGTGEITGTVTAADTGRPIRDAFITLSGSS